ncbi:MAG: NAD(+) synthase, partial [Lentisphaeria bacterium]
MHVNRLYNCAVVIQEGEVVGVIPKSYLPNYKEYYEKRWFTPGHNISDEIEINGDLVPFGDTIIFQGDRYFTFGIEICEDFWNIIPPSSYHTIAGANVIFNMSASNDLVGKAQYRRNLVLNQSGRCMSAYCYTSSGVHESTTDLLFSGHAMIAENGSMIAETPRFQRNSDILFADIDCQRLVYTRMTESSFNDNAIANNYQVVHLRGINQPSLLNRKIDALPFVPNDPSIRGQHCEEILSIQKASLAKRLEHIGNHNTVIGISGGLDSTLALLVTYETYKMLKIDTKNIITVTMPGFGTTNRTYQNAIELCKLLGTDLREIDIKDACTLHFEQINHDPSLLDVTYENIQARERTKILMNIANKENAIVIGTGDLSEIALGWSTYNGDHMSMYAINNSVPKTLIQYMIQYIADASSSKKSVKDKRSLKEILYDIKDTPISPELLPPDETGEISQKTEERVGPYDLHDFFLYHTIKYGASPEKVCFLAAEAFMGKYDFDKIIQWHNVFIKRFFSQQFKRSCMPDGPKVGSISMSPR